MASIGQIIYNVQDYQTSGGYISTSGGNDHSIISSKDNPSYDSSKLDICAVNLVPLFGSQFTKLGVNAPPGTRFILNGEDERSGKVILVGRSGVYELDEPVTSMKFIKSRKYIKDTDASTEVLQLGMQELEEADEYRKNRMQTELVGLTEQAYWEKYNEIQAAYDEKYQSALSQFNMGMNGVYKLPNPDNPNAAENYEDLYNVIVDFIFV